MELIKKVTVSTVLLKDVLYYQNTPVLKYTIEYPSFSSPRYPWAVRRMNAFYEKNALDYQKYIRTVMLKSAIENYQNSIANGYPVRAYEAMLTYNVTYNQSCAVSLYNQKYEYTAGAHGNTIQSSQTWNLNTGKQIPLKRLFPGNPHYAADLKTEINAQIASNPENFFENYHELVNKTFNRESYYLTPDALAIYFQQYDIAPYSTGIPTFLIPYSYVGAQLPHCIR